MGALGYIIGDTGIPVEDNQMSPDHAVFATDNWIQWLHLTMSEYLRNIEIIE